jgi:hypothetical protein
MRKVWFGMAFVAVMIAQPALAQEYKKNFRECAKANGLHLAPTNGRLHRWRYYGEAQHMAFMDCVTRKANLAPASSAKAVSPVSR